MEDLFIVRSNALPDSTRVAGLQGTEGISRLYQLDLYLLVAGAEGQHLDLADVIGAKGTLEIARHTGRTPFVFHGIFAAVELLHETDERSVLRATLVPQLWQLTKTLHSRIFTDRSVPEIIEEVLQDGGLGGDDYAFRLTERYATHEHVCQYQESNFDFLSRWMEREGMYYFFEQGESGERLVITDSRSFQAGLDGKAVRFHALSGTDVSAKEALHTFTCKHQALPSSVRLQDYDYGRPTLDVSGRAPVSRVGSGEISVHGRRFFSPEEGKRLAKIRAEELLAQQVVYRGAGTALHLRPGYCFKLEEHPRPAFDREYLATTVEHYGNIAAGTPELRALTGLDRPDAYWVEVTAIPSNVQFRAESRTPWPRIYGSENGTICGPAQSDYAQIDDAGRYNVKFKFDESDLRDGKASTWVRMAQPHGGGVEGWHFPLRKGTEVIFTFLGGDPDRPVIAGVVPNVLTPSPVTRTNHTTNIIQTGGRNRLEFEDRAGHERITLQTPYANTMFRMGAPNDDFTLILKTDGTLKIDTGKDKETKIGGFTKDIFFGGKSSLTIGGKADLYIGGTTSLNISAAATMTVGTSVDLKVGTHYSKKVLDLSEKATEVKDTKTKVESNDTNLKTCGLCLTTAGFTIWQ